MIANLAGLPVTTLINEPKDNISMTYPEMSYKGYQAHSRYQNQGDVNSMRAEGNKIRFMRIKIQSQACF